MSDVIDKKIVEMRFDNRDFERNVAHTMSTVDKLKSKLKFEGIERGARNISAAMRQVDFTPLLNSVVMVKKKFSALETIASTAVSNITNRVVNSAHRMAKAMTIEPVHTGFSEYELKMGSMQTIMASTGASIAEVNKYLNELNTYSDKTIYSFSDMTNNIGKFTNAGVELGTAVSAIKGISNVAAISGANANEASRSMYNFAQALSSGSVKLIDWKSIELANMATNQFKNELIKTAVQLGVVQKAEDGMYRTTSGKLFNSTKNFNDTLQEQWMTTDVLIKTLERYSDETKGIGKQASKAAQDVKTWTMLKDTVAEAIQSGWAQSWEIVIGDLNQAKEVFTKLSEFIGGFVAKSADARNAFLSKIFIGSWDQMKQKIQDTGIRLKDFRAMALKVGRETDKELRKVGKSSKEFDKSLASGWLTRDIFVETLRNLANNAKKTSTSASDLNAKLAKFQKIVDAIWAGEFKNGAERVEALTKAGYDYNEVQTLVNKSVGDHKLTLEDLGAKQLKVLGYTKDEIKAIRALAKESKSSSGDVAGLIETIGQTSGRRLIIDSVITSVSKLREFMAAIKEETRAVNKAFDAWSIKKGIGNLNEFVHAIKVDSGVVTNFAKIIDGLSSALELSWTFISSGFMTGIKLLKAVLSLFGMDIMTLLARVADYITLFHDWINANTIFTHSLNKVAEIIAAVLVNLRDFIRELFTLKKTKELVANLIATIDSFFGMFGSAFQGISTSDIIQYINDFFKALNNLISGKTKAFSEWASENKFLASTIDVIVKSVDALIEGINKLFKTVKENDIFPNFIAKVKDYFSDVGSWAGVDFSWFNGDTISKAIKKLFASISDLVSGATEIADVGFNMAEGWCDGFRDGAKSILKAAVRVAKDILVKVCAVLGIHSPSTEFFGIARNCILGAINGVKDTMPLLYEFIQIALRKASELVRDDFGYILNTASSGMMVWWTNSMLRHIAIIAKVIANPFDAIASGFKNLATETSKLIKTFRRSMGIKTIGNMFKDIAIGLAIVAGALVVISKIPSPGKAVAIAVGLLVAIGLVIGAIAHFSGTTKIEENAIRDLVITVLAISAGMLVIGKTFNLLADSVNWHNIWPAALAMIGVVGSLGGLAAELGYISKKVDPASLDKSAKMLISITGSLWAMAHIVKIVSGIDAGAAMKMGVFSGAVVLLYGAFVAIGKFGGRTLVRAKRTLTDLALAMGVLVVTMKIAASLNADKMNQGMLNMIQLALFLTMTTALLRVANKIPSTGDFGSLSKALLGITASLILMSVSIKLLSGLSVGELIKGGGAAVVLAAVVTKIFKSISQLLNLPDGTKGKGRLASVTSLVVAIAGAMVTMATAVNIFGTMDIGVLGKGLGAVSALGIMLWVLMQSAGKVDAGAFKPMLVMLISMGLLVGAMVAFTKLLKPEEMDRFKTVTAALAAGLMAMSLASLVMAQVAKVMSTVPRAASAIGKALLIMAAVVFGSTGIMVILGAISEGLSHLGFDAVEAIEKAGNVLEAVGIAIGSIVSGLAIGATAGLPIVAENFRNFMEEIEPALKIIKKAPSGWSIIGKLTGLALGITELAGASLVSTVVSAGGFTILAMGKPLSEFMTDISGFIDGAKKLPSGKSLRTKLSGLSDGISAIIDYSAGWVLSSWGGKTLGSIAEPLSKFMTDIKGYIDGANSIGPDSGANVAALANSISTLASITPPSETDWTSISDGLEPLGTALTTFATDMAKLTPETKASLQNGVTAMQEMSNAMSNEGFQKWGASAIDWATVQANLSGFVDSVSKFSMSSSAISIDDVDASSRVYEVADDMFSLATAFPAATVWEAAFGSSSKMLTFAENSKQFVDALKEYATKASALTNEDAGYINNSIKIARKLVKLNDELPNCSYLAKLLGDFKDIGQFGTDASAFVSAIVEAANNATTLTDDQVKAFERVVELGGLITTLVNDIQARGGLKSLWDGSKDLSGFGNQIVLFFQNLAKIQDLDFDSVTLDFIGVAAQGIESFCTTLEYRIPKARGSVQKFVSGIQNELNAGMDAVANSNAVKAKPENIGGYITDGLAKGITDGQIDVTNAIEDVCQAAITAAEEKFKIGSPSKVFADEAHWCIRGFTDEVYASRGAMANSVTYAADGAVNSMSDTASRINAVLQSGMNFNPVIKPLVDSSDISRAASYMNSAFASPYVPAYAARAGFDARPRPLSASDVAAQLAASRTAPSTQNIYTVNGITYDDGSGVARALDELVRHIKIERRT